MFYSTPPVVKPQYDIRAAAHPGAQALMAAVAEVIRSSIDFEAVIEAATNRIAEGFREIDALTEIINSVRMGQGLMPLALVNGDAAEQISQAVVARDEFWEGRVEQMVQERVKAIASAEPPAAGPGSPRSMPEPHIPGASEGLGDPPAPRGGAPRRAPAR